MLHFARFAVVAVFALGLAAPAFAQSEEEVYANIESLHGDADGFFAVFGQLQDDIMFGDPLAIADSVSYPITINANGETYDVLEQQDLLDNFDALISQETQNAIGEQDINDLIVTSDGVGLGNGAVWLSNICLDDSCASTVWKVIAINN